MKVTKEDARRFLVARQLLAPARSLDGGPDAVLEVVHRLGSIQLDQVDVAGRSHDLVLHARVADYEPGWCDELYKRREIFEAYNKGLSFVPASEFAWFRVRRSSRAQKALADNADVAKRVLDRIRAEGPMSSLDFERETGPTKDWFGAPMNAVRAVLEAYATVGELGTARRDGTHRYYDVPERLLPAEVLAHDLTLREQLRHKMLSQYRAHGLLGATARGEGFFADLGPAKPDGTYPGRDALREELVELGELMPVEVEGLSGKRFVVRDDAGSSGASSTSTTCGSCMCRRTSAVGGGTSCRSSFGTVLSAGSSRASSGTKARYGCSLSGGRTASSRGGPRGSSTRCTRRSARTFASRRQTASSGHPSSVPRSGSSGRRH